MTPPSEGIERFREVCEAANAANVPVRGYVSCVVGCPYQVSRVGGDTRAYVVWCGVVRGCVSCVVGCPYLASSAPHSFTQCSALLIALLIRHPFSIS